MGFPRTNQICTQHEKKHAVLLVAGINGCEGSVTKITSTVVKRKG